MLVAKIFNLNNSKSIPLIAIVNSITRIFLIARVSQYYRTFFGKFFQLLMYSITEFKLSGVEHNINFIFNLMFVLRIRPFYWEPNVFQFLFLYFKVLWLFWLNARLVIRVAELVGAGTFWSKPDLLWRSGSGSI